VWLNVYSSRQNQDSLLSVDSIFKRLEYLPSSTLSMCRMENVLVKNEIRCGCNFAILVDIRNKTLYKKA